jgi:hypothetical protein
MQPNHKPEQQLLHHHKLLQFHETVSLCLGMQSKHWFFCSRMRTPIYLLPNTGAEDSFHVLRVRLWSVELAPLDHLESDWFISCKKNHVWGDHCICWSVLVIIKSWYLFSETLAHVCNCFLVHWYRQFDSFEPSNESTIWTESRSTASSHLDILDDMRFKFEQYQNTWCNHRRICEVYKPRNKLASFHQ